MTIYLNPGQTIRAHTGDESLSRSTSFGDARHATTPMTEAM
jgi:hypothetical protein